MLVDLDPQCNATTRPGPTASRQSSAGLAAAAQGIAAHGDGHRRRSELLPGSRRFKDVEQLAAGEAGQAATLSQHLASGLSAYDFVLIDCPPSLGQLTQTALASSTEVLMPIQCEYFAMEGLAQMIEVIRQVMDRQPNRLQFGGIVLTMYDHTLELTHEVDDEVRDFFGEIVFQYRDPARRGRQPKRPAMAAR